MVVVVVAQLCLIHQLWWLVRWLVCKSINLWNVESRQRPKLSPKSQGKDQKGNADSQVRTEIALPLKKIISSLIGLKYVLNAIANKLSILNH